MAIKIERSLNYEGAIDVAIELVHIACFSADGVATWDDSEYGNDIVVENTGMDEITITRREGSHVVHVDWAVDVLTQFIYDASYESDIEFERQYHRQMWRTRIRPFPHPVVDRDAIALEAMNRAGL